MRNESNRGIRYDEDFKREAVRFVLEEEMMRQPSARNQRKTKLIELIDWLPYSLAIRGLLHQRTTSLGLSMNIGELQTISDQRMRWCVMALLDAESIWNKIHRFQRRPMLQRAISKEVQQRIQSHTFERSPSRISTKKRT
ncbi:MAG TPA: hypothetical protein PLW14_11435 [Chlorobiota bacterium]|nr:hypothetical protein [Chlorobiota bacterium]